MSMTQTRIDGFAPAPVSTTTQGSQDTMSKLSLSGGTNNNYIYIYSFLGTLFILLCVALAVLLRTLVRRRRLDAQFAEFDSEAAQPTDTTRRRKKRKNYGEKPGFIDAWIGDGPLPTSLSTEALLEVSQPFSVTREPVMAEFDMNEKDISSIEQPMQLKAKQSLLSLPQSASVSSCSHSEEKSSMRAASPPLTPAIQEIERIQVGFLIAMPRPPPLPSLKSSASSRRGASSSNLSISKDSLNDAESFWSLAESKWSDHLADGELPELNVGVSTVCIPVDRSDKWDA